MLDKQVRFTELKGLKGLTANVIVPDTTVPKACYTGAGLVSSSKGKL